jgi:hypothetical protein
MCIEWPMKRSEVVDLPLCKQVFDLQGPTSNSQLVPLNSGGHVQSYPWGDSGLFVQLPECRHGFNSSHCVFETLQ